MPLVFLLACGGDALPRDAASGDARPPGDADASDAGFDAAEPDGGLRCRPPNEPPPADSTLPCGANEVWTPCGEDRVCDGEGNCVPTPVPVPLAPPDGSSTRFGTALAAGPDRVAVGDPRGEGTGAVYLYRRTPTGWELEATVTVPEGLAFEVRGFGDALALDGDTLLVGAPESRPSGTDSGAVFVFERSDDGWVPVHIWTVPSGIADDWFGGAVAVQGSLAAASAIGFDHGEEARSSGRVYVIRRSTDGVWTTEEPLDAPMPEPNANFGLALALDGSRLAVAEPMLFGSRGGLAYTFDVNDSTPEPDTLVPACLRAAPGFAMLGIAASEGLVAVSWVGFEGSSEEDPVGAVALFAHEPGSPAFPYEALRVPHPEGTRGTQFGATVALNKAVMVVGAERAMVEGLAAAGEAFVLGRSADGAWRHAARLRAPSPTARAAFGYALAIAGPTVLVAANPEGASGGVWAFEP